MNIFQRFTYRFVGYRDKANCPHVGPGPISSYKGIKHKKGHRVLLNGILNDFLNRRKSNIKSRNRDWSI